MHREPRLVQLWTTVNLLKERFGQPNKIVTGHKQVLLHLPNPTYQLSSLQTFYEKLENHVRGLGALGRLHEIYEDLLILIVLTMRTNLKRTNLARGHARHEWTFIQLGDYH